MHKSEVEMKDRDDTLCDILASAAFDKYPSDFESKYRKPKGWWKFCTSSLAQLN